MSLRRGCGLTRCEIVYTYSSCLPHSVPIEMTRYSHSAAAPDPSSENPSPTVRRFWLPNTDAIALLEYSVASRRVAVSTPSFLKLLRHHSPEIFEYMYIFANRA